MGPRFITLAVAAALALAADLPVRAEPIALKLATPSPPAAPVNARLLTPWAEDVTKASDGTLDVKVFAGGTLANFVNVLDRTLNGVIDIGWGGHGSYSSEFPKSFVAMLPFETRSATEAGRALWALYEKGVIADEYQRVRLLGLADFPNLSLHSRQPINSLANMRGLKVIALSRVVASAVEKLGAAPVTVQFSEVYQALSRGTADAVAGGWPTIPALRLTEVVNHHTMASLGTEAMFIIMNKDSYARLPEKGRKTIDDLSGQVLVRRAATVIDGNDAEVSSFVSSQQGQSVIRLSPEEEARWRERVAPVTEEWTRSTPDGARVLAAFREEVAKIRAGM